MYIEQIRTYEIKKVAFKFNFLFLGYDIGHEKKIKNLGMMGDFRSELHDCSFLVVFKIK